MVLLRVDVGRTNLVEAVGVVTIIGIDVVEIVVEDGTVELVLDVTVKEDLVGKDVVDVATVVLFLELPTVVVEGTIVDFSADDVVAMALMIGVVEDVVVIASLVDVDDVAKLVEVAISVLDFIAVLVVVLVVVVVLVDVVNPGVVFDDVSGVVVDSVVDSFVVVLLDVASAGAVVVDNVSGVVLDVVVDILGVVVVESVVLTGIFTASH